MLRSIPFNIALHNIYCYVKKCVQANYSYVNDYKCGHKYTRGVIA